MVAFVHIVVFVATAVAFYIWGRFDGYSSAEFPNYVRGYDKGLLVERRHWQRLTGRTYEQWVLDREAHQEAVPPT